MATGDPERKLLICIQNSGFIGISKNIYRREELLPESSDVEPSQFSMVSKTYQCCKETSDSVVYSAMDIQKHKQHKQIPFQHGIELDAVSLGIINSIWGSQSSHRLPSPSASDMYSILHYLSLKLYLYLF